MSDLEYLSPEWVEDDMKEYNIGIKSLPPLVAGSNVSEDALRHIAFLGQEILRLRAMIRALIKERK